MCLLLRVPTQDDSIVGGDDDHDESQQQTGEEVYERDIHSFSDSKGARHGSGVF